MTTLGEKFKALRAASGRTLQEVTDALGLADGHVAAIETGKIGNPRVDLAGRLAQYYGADLGELMRTGELRGPSPESLVIVRLFEEQMTTVERRLIVKFAQLLAESKLGHDGGQSESSTSPVARRHKTGASARAASKGSRGRAR